MIIVKLLGGLGNQMFQYALGRALSEKMQVPLYLDLSAFESYTLRKFELDAFCIKYETLSQSQISKLKMIHKFPILKKILFGRNFSFIKETSFSYMEQINNVKAPAYLEGYWQSSKYFESITEMLLKDFELKNSPNAKNTEMLQLIENSNSVSIHIRRGDYVTNPHATQFHGVLPLSYYDNAIKQLAAKEKTPTYFIFSDDPEWVKNNLKIAGNVYYVDHNTIGAEDLRLMKACKHNIIANSTFSWWGAWLNRNPSKKVILPAKWFADSKIDTKDLIPTRWESVPTL